jgi:hypothetical protein
VQSAPSGRLRRAPQSAAGCGEPGTILGHEVLARPPSAAVSRVRRLSGVEGTAASVARVSGGDPRGIAVGTARKDLRPLRSDGLGFFSLAHQTAPGDAEQAVVAAAAEEARAALRALRAGDAGIKSGDRGRRRVIVAAGGARGQHAGGDQQRARAARPAGFQPSGSRQARRIGAAMSRDHRGPCFHD